VCHPASEMILGTLLMLKYHIDEDRSKGTHSEEALTHSSVSWSQLQAGEL
jgi:hypothetical protein